MSKPLCDAIAKVRNRLRHIPNSNILYLDETYYRLDEAPKHTLVAPAQYEFVQVYADSRYAGRYDMITFISGDTVLPPIIYSPEERKELEVKGIRAFMLNEFIEDYIGRAVAGLDKYPLYLMCDQSNIHNLEKMKESFEDGFCFEIVDISFLPATAAKRLSPLDNGIYYSWKERCRNHYPLNPNNIKQIMNDEWMKITPQQIATAFKHCGLSNTLDTYYDCPNPDTHKHRSKT